MLNSNAKEIKGAQRMGQQKRSKLKRETLIAAQQERGQSQNPWCEANGVNYHTFPDRARRLRRREKPTQWAEAQAAADTGAIQVEVGTFRVIVPGNFNEASLLRVCKVLASLC